MRSETTLEASVLGSRPWAVVCSDFVDSGLGSEPTPCFGD